MAQKKQIALNYGSKCPVGAVGLVADSPVKVVKVKDGSVGLVDKLKGYLHTLSVSIAGILVFLNEVTPVLNFMPGDSKQWVNVAIVFLTAVFNLINPNQHWVDDH